MPANPAAVDPDFQRRALAVTDVGTWRCSIDEEWLRCDAVMADQFGLAGEEALQGIPFARVRQIIHPEDRHLFDHKNERVRGVGGVVMTEYRIVPRPGVVRRLLIRGRYDSRDPHAVGTTGHGIAIDITTSRTVGQDGDQWFDAASEVEDGAYGRLHEVADAALALRRAVDRLDEEKVAGLREATDIALRLIAHRLARRPATGTLN